MVGGKRGVGVQEFSARRPVRQLEWEETEDGLIVVLRPKFGPSRLGRWFSSRLGRPYLRLRLDARGSAFWRLCDQGLTVSQIGVELEERFADQIEDLDQLLPRFIYSMEKAGAIGWETGET